MQHRVSEDYDSNKVYEEQVVMSPPHEDVDIYASGNGSIGETSMPAYQVEDYDKDAMYNPDQEYNAIGSVRNSIQEGFSDTNSGQGE